MLSVASVSSASGAANYFAKDDYYVGDGPAELSEWGGKGAEALGLSGPVSKEDFERVLDGKLPDGTVVNGAEKRRAGVDLTFSMPKSASLMAQLGGDKRVLTAQETAVKATMAYLEKHFAEARDYSRNPNGEAVQTGKLLYALFQHDTSRKLDPQNHTHAVIAAMTQDKAGNWKALWNGEVWKNNSVLGSIYNAALRSNLERIGYRTELTGKHGQFEIQGVSREVIEAFSQRSAEIDAKANQIGISTAKERDKVVVNTRDPKLNPDDKQALRQEWAKRAEGLGFDAKRLVEQARARTDNGREGTLGTVDRVRGVIAAVQETTQLYTRPADELTTNGLHRMGLTPTQLRTELATASAVRVIGERETSWTRGELVKTALDLGIKGVTAEGVEARMEVLIDKGQMLPGKSTRLDGAVEKFTTPEHAAIERATLANVTAGRDASAGIIEAAAAPERLRAVSGEHDLNAEQIAAGTLALSSNDRTVVIQGVAGAGKTTLISAIASVAREEGRDVIGLAFANKMVNDLRNETDIRSSSGEPVKEGIEAKTVSSFVNQHLRAALHGSGPTFEASRAALTGKVLVLDEASLVANKPMNDLLTIANRLGVEKLVMIGDRAQLQPIEAGKSFSLIQSDGPALARLDTSLRQRTEHMKDAAGLARAGKFRESFASLGDKVVEAGKDHLAVAAKTWLDLSPEDRERTAIYSSGRDARATLNKMVQDGLRAEGSIKGEGMVLDTLRPAHATREELRYASTYTKGQLLEVMRQNAPGGLSRGRYDVEGLDEKGRVLLRDENGKLKRFDPARIDPADKRDALRLSEKTKETIHEGDKVRWTEKDDARKLMKSEEAKILGIKDGVVTVENRHGETVELKQNDKMLERMGLAYVINMHQAQGDTRDMAIGEMHSSARHLSNQRLALVMMTRVRDDITIITNDRDQLLSQIGRNPGDKTSALETLGEKQVENARSDRAAPDFNPRIPEHLKVGEASADRLPSVDKESLRAVPQIDLPERNIERAR
ncbi:MobF family relaxase [Aurantiacibacter poecillastricola]|uniref:MobF family relaxase n=1 Tax=Aurantiacibacter poecillastricola TaxID=3064385 RepID=UPI00273F3CA5|nr:MobF family relaxase [Aurantiacibacter sp. 219JJ12-13]MDP5263369.1 MobF family relaxase [Aurantiacibacter sp. 219JJ12-13]